jgi:hypothetical protein
MTIAEFIIKLGFKIDGGEKAEKASKDVEKLNFSAVKLLAGVTALNAAFYGMMTLAVEAGIGLQKFATNTGLSGDELQRWQFRAEKANVSGKEVVNALEAIQHARAAIAFGDASAAAPWALLGIDPRQDPFKVLEQLRKAVATLDPAIARQKLSEMGFGENMFYMLRNIGAGGLSKDLIVSKEEADRLANLGGAWKAFLFTLMQFGTRFGSQFAEPLTAVLNQMSKLLEIGAKFASWLEKGGTGADIFKYAMLGLLTVLGGLALAIPVLMTGPLAEVLLFFGLLAISIGGTILLIEDFWGAMDGKKSLFDWSAEIAMVNRMAAAIQWVIDKYNDLKKSTQIWGEIAQAAGGNVGPLIGRIQTPGGFSSTVEQNNTFHVSSPSPEGAARRTSGLVNGGFRSAVSDAFASSPIPAR